MDERTEAASLYRLLAHPAPNPIEPDFVARTRVTATKETVDDDREAMDLLDGGLLEARIRTTETKAKETVDDDQEMLDVANLSALDRIDS
jgi:hypothetical protein